VDSQKPKGFKALERPKEAANLLLLGIFSGGIRFSKIGVSYNVAVLH